MNKYYNQNYSREEMELVLSKIKSCVKNNRYVISQNENRKENIDFINEYNLSVDKRKSVLLKLEVDDFCHSLKNKKIGFEDEILYVFVPCLKLFNLDNKEEEVDIYTKFNLIDLPSGLRTVVVSFHKRNKAIKYLFR